MASSQLLDRYARLEAEVAKACASAGRKREDVLLVAVSKFHPAHDILALSMGGQIDFGENYVQEAEAKKAELASSAPSIRWHMIGHVQSRKAGQVAGKYELVHTVDTLKLADALEKRLRNEAQDILIEVNIAAEPQKSGIMPEDLPALGAHIAHSCPHLVLRGLMCLPPVFDSGDAARPYFARLRKLRDLMEMELGQKLPELSMGMSGDFVGAIAEGATIIRIGTNIFGPRPAQRPL